MKNYKQFWKSISSEEIRVVNIKNIPKINYINSCYAPTMLDTLEYLENHDPNGHMIRHFRD
jgi:hypothetical protein